jgi:hypothetical protein
MMAKVKKVGKKIYVAAALVCEKAIVGEDKTLSLIRIVDTITLPEGLTVPAGAAFELTNLALVIILKTGEGKPGKHKVHFHWVMPSGDIFLAAESDIDLRDVPQSGGANLISHLRLRWEKAGLYFIEVRVDGDVVSRVPLNVQTSQVSVANTKAGKKS